MARTKGPQVQQAYEYIKEKILSFDLLPGALISDNSLALDLNMSRSPIREAIMRLIADGIVEIKDRRTQVSSISLEDIIEICQVREAVEIEAVNIIKDNKGMTIEQKERLSSVFQSLQNSTELVENYYFDDLFHETIMNSSNNRRLKEISDKMRLQIVRARWLNSVLPDRKIEAAKEHENIYNALMNDDYKASINSLRGHLRNSAENFKKVLTSQQYGPQFTIAMATISSSIHGSDEKYKNKP